MADLRGPQKTSFAGQVRKALQRIGMDYREISAAELAHELDMIADKEKQRLYNTMRDFIKRGEVTRPRDGVYVYKGQAAPANGNGRDRMWAVVRARRQVTVEDLQQLAGVGAEYAKEFMRLLVRNGAARRIDRTGQATVYRLTTDSVDIPAAAAEANAAKLRNIRAQKKDEALAALTAAEVSVKMARRALEELGT